MRRMLTVTLAFVLSMAVSGLALAGQDREIDQDSRYEGKIIVWTDLLVKASTEIIDVLSSEDGIRPRDAEWIATLTGPTESLRLVHQSALETTPPPLYEDRHDDLLDITDQYQGIGDTCDLIIEEPTGEVAQTCFDEIADVSTELTDFLETFQDAVDSRDSDVGEPVDVTEAASTRPQATETAEPEPTATEEPEGYTLTGRLIASPRDQLALIRSSDDPGTNCAPRSETGIDRFIDIVVRDAEGTIIGTGGVENGQINEDAACSFEFEPIELPDSDIYVVEIGEVVDLTFRADDLEEMNWDVEHTERVS